MTGNFLLSIKDGKFEYDDLVQSEALKKNCQYESDELMSLILSDRGVISRNEKTYIKMNTMI